jgi:hypothetical protein
MLGGAAQGAAVAVIVPAASGPGVLLLPFFAAAGAVIGAVVGGALGTTAAVPKDEAEKIEATIRNHIVEHKIQETFAENVLKTCLILTSYRFDFLAGQGSTSSDQKLDYIQLKGKGFDTALEISAKKVGFEGGEGKNPSIAFFMIVHTRLVRTSDGKEIHSREFHYKSEEHKFDDWANDNARIFREEFYRCYEDLSKRIAEELFLLSDFSIKSGNDLCGLRPMYPEIRYNFWKKNIQFVEADSLQPTLRWEPFPKSKDKTEQLGRISDVTYELKIWRVDDNSPVELVYNRKGLQNSSHKIERPLTPLTRYFWSVRAGFKLDGHYRQTRWSFSKKPNHPPCEYDHIPNDNYFRFYTSLY